ncbi:MAG: hypothetical protein AB7K68_02935 [Bacteriovoracia bacterium]
MKFVRLLIAFCTCVPALAMPYRLRLTYMHTLAYLVHAPYRLFGILARSFLAQLEEKNPYERP